MLELETLIGRTLDGKYRLDAALGRGGMGAVFRATHLGTSRTVAVKVIAPGLAELRDFGERFAREARALGRLRHPNIVDVTDFGVADGIAYLVMEYLDGCSLAEVLREEGPLPLDWTLDVIAQAASAIDEAHGHGVLHRDLKPDNIWLEPNRRGGYTVKVLDFGLAKLVDAPGERDLPASPGPEAATASLPTVAAIDADATLATSSPASYDVTGIVTDSEITRLTEPPRAAGADGQPHATVAGAIMGTPAYMSPEQCAGAPIDRRSDVYGLAVVTYHMLAGRLPFQGDTATLLRAHQHEEPPPIGAFWKDVPPAVERLLASALAKDPSDRPDGAGSFASALRVKAEGTGGVLREAFILSAGRLGSLLKVSAILLSPALVAACLLTVNAILLATGTIPRAAGLPIAAVGTLVIVVDVLAGWSILGSVALLMVLYALATPLRQVQGWALLKTYWPRLRSYWNAANAMTGRVMLRAAGPVAVCSIALLIVILFLPRPPRPVRIAIVAAFAVCSIGGTVWALRRGSRLKGIENLASVMLLDDVPLDEATRRAATLTARSRDAVRPFQLALMVVLGVAGGVFGFAGARLVETRGFAAASGLLALPFVLFAAVVFPWLSLVAALTHLRARREAGENVEDLLAGFERRILPDSHWQLRARDRIRAGVAASRGRIPSP